MNKYIKISNYNYIMDNRYWSNECPALMQDGRFITNYIRSNVFEQLIKNTNGIESVHDYRLFLQKNGDSILNREREILVKINTCDVNGKCVNLSNNIHLYCTTCTNKSFIENLPNKTSNDKVYCNSNK